MNSRHLFVAHLTLAMICAATSNHAAAAGYESRPHLQARHTSTWMIDARHGHDRYYPPVGTGVRALERGYAVSRFHGVPYYFRDGIWYRNQGRNFVVVRPPNGALVTVLPPFYTTFTFGGIPYYYADSVYYRWDAGRKGYLVSEPPVPAASTSASSNEIFVYPKNGQSEEQQSKDRYECHRWAADESGFDPTQPAAANTSAREDYGRAQAVCLEARGYSVK